MDQRPRNSPDWNGLAAVFITAFIVLALVNGLRQVVPPEWIPDPSLVMNFRRR